MGLDGMGDSTMFVERCFVGACSSNVERHAVALIIVLMIYGSESL